MPGRWDNKIGSAITGQAYGRKQAAPDAAEPSLDPYLRWAVHTSWQGFARQAGWRGPEDPDGEVRIIGHLPSAAALQDLTKKNLGAYKLQVSDIYFQDLPGTVHRPLHFTATLSRQAVEQWLVTNPLGLRWRLTSSMRDALLASRPSPKGLYGPDRDAADLRADHRFAEVKPDTRHPEHPAKLEGAIVLVDHGCPFLHQQFLHPDGTRVVALWDQGAQPGSRKSGYWPWQAPLQMGYGRELGPRALQAVSQASRQGTGDLEETVVYRALDYLIDADDARRRVWYGTHGGHLLDLAGGRPDPVSRREDDPAASANLLFVQLPMAAALDSAGASLSAHLLDGVRYALSTCRPGSPVVVTISYGGHAGPHDGTSLIEEALDDVLKHCAGNVAIVLAAGNARRSRCHARRSVRPNRSALLRAALSTGDVTDTFVEVWYAPPAAGQVLQLRVRPPNRLWSPWLAPGEEVVLRADIPALDVIALVRHDSRVPNGRQQMALLAVCPTEQPVDIACGLAEPGVWEIECRLVSAQDPPIELPDDAEVLLDAWIERDEPDRLGTASRPYFQDQTVEDEHGTLSSLATGSQTLVVGGFNMATRQPAPYSSLDAEGRSNICVLAACEESAQEPSLVAAATRSSEVLRLNGTSLAAPVLARRLYNHLHERLKQDPALRLTTRSDWLDAVAAVTRQEPAFLMAPPPN